MLTIICFMPSGIALVAIGALRLALVAAPAAVFLVLGIFMIATASVPLWFMRVLALYFAFVNVSSHTIVQLLLC